MLDTETNASVFAGATAAVLLLSFALAATRSLPIPFALLLLGAIYAIPDGERAVAAPIYGGALLLTGELAYWSLDERVLQRVLAGTFAPRLLAVLAVCVGSIPLSAVALIAAEADVPRSPATTAAGAAAVVACLALLAVLARRSVSS